MSWSWICWNLSHLVWALEIVMLAGRKREGHGDEHKNTLTVGASWLSECSVSVGLCLGVLYLWTSCGGSSRRSVTLTPGDGTFSLSPSTLRKTQVRFQTPPNEHETRTFCACPLLKGSTHKSRNEAVAAIPHLTVYLHVSWVGSVCVTQHNCWATNLMFSVTEDSLLRVPVNRIS